MSLLCLSVFNVYHGTLIYTTTQRYSLWGRMYADIKYPRSVDKILLLVETLQTNRSNTDCRDIRHTAIASQHNILLPVSY